VKDLTKENSGAIIYARTKPTLLVPAMTG